MDARFLESEGQKVMARYNRDNLLSVNGVGYRSGFDPSASVNSPQLASRGGIECEEGLSSTPEHDAALGAEQSANSRRGIFAILPPYFAAQSVQYQRLFESLAKPGLVG